MHSILDRPRVQNALKALVLIAIGLFLYSRIAGGTLLYYIAEGFAWLVLLAAIGLVVVGLSYQLMRPENASSEYEHEHEHEHAHAHAHTHNHPLTLGALFLLMLPVILGVFFSPQPLGAAALERREVKVGGVRSTMPAAVRSSAAKASLDKNVLDWSQLFANAQDPAAQYAGETARVTGFVFRDSRFATDQFLVTRFLVSCCVADASVSGLVVRWPDAAALPSDQWVQVEGHFAAGEFAGQPYPILVATSLKPVDVPNQPYLYP